MSDYIKQWLDIIENMSTDNTYKLAWGRALLEIILETKPKDEDLIIKFEVIAKKMLKYYWNQEYFFNLKQSANRKPVFVKEVEELIEYVSIERDSNIPIWFDKAEEYLKLNPELYNLKIKKLANVVKENVSHRFLNCNKKTYPLYECNLADKIIVFKSEEVEDLREYAFVLSQLLNYKWAQLLESYNSSPRIALKVKNISDSKIKRQNLRKFREVLIAQMVDGNIIDFYTGKVLEEHEISIDHVIPWSFMYSDDLWNLVITNQSTNSSKSNKIPSEKDIERLIERNEKMLKNIDPNDKFYRDVKLAIEHEYVQKFYLQMRL